VTGLAADVRHGGGIREPACHDPRPAPTDGHVVHRSDPFHPNAGGIPMKPATRHTVGLLGALALVAALCGTQISQANSPVPWGPILKDKKGNVKPLPEKIEKMKDEDWMRIAYTDFDGLKPRMAVFLPPVREEDVSAKDMNSDLGKLMVLYTQRSAKQPDGTASPEIQLRQALGATNRFRMVEGQSSVDHLLDEQDFGASGRVSGASAAHLKQLTGAQYVARVSIIEINPQKEAKNITVVGGALTGNTIGLGSIDVKGTVAYVCINAKIVNVASGDIVSDITVTGTSKAHGLGIAGGILKGFTGGIFGTGGVINTETAASLGEAIQACVNKVAYLAAGRFEDLPLTMNVLDADERSVTVEGGKDLGLQPGMMLKLESNLGPITNAKGDTLDWKRVDNGQLKVIRVLPTVSTCEYIDGGKNTKRDDLATFEPKSGK
jgi:curli biogenesis system outer membrane secretion channel CsgG